MKAVSFVILCASAFAFVQFITILDTFSFKIMYHIACYGIFKIIKIAFKMSLIRHRINL